MNKCDGVDRILRLFSLPSLPFDSASSGLTLSLVGVLKTMADAMPQTTLLKVAQHVKKTLDSTRHLWTTTAGGKSTLMSWTDISCKYRLQSGDQYLTYSAEFLAPSDFAAANSSFRQLVTLHFHVYVLAQIYSTASYAQGRVASTILQTINGVEGPNIIGDLGALYRGFLWESIILNLQEPSGEVNIANSTSTPGLILDQPALTILDTPAAPSSAETNADPEPAASSGLDTPARAKPAPKGHNLMTVKALAQNLSKVTTPFFQGMELCRA